MRLHRALAIATLAATAAGCGGNFATLTTPPAPPTPTTVEISGTVSVPADRASISDTPTLGDPCTAAPGYDDIAPGSQAVVTDQAGTTIGFADLGPGMLIAGGDDFLTDPRCQSIFSVHDIPGGKSLYGVHVGRDSRGVLRYHPADIHAPIAITIG